MRPSTSGRSPLAGRLLDGWLYQSLALAAALSLLARAFLVREERFASGLIGAAALVWSAGDIYWWRALSQLEEPPFPSFSDGFYLADWLEHDKTRRGHSALGGPPPISRLSTTC